MLKITAEINSPREAVTPAVKEDAVKVLVPARHVREARHDQGTIKARLAGWTTIEEPENLMESTDCSKSRIGGDRI